MKTNMNNRSQQGAVLVVSLVLLTVLTLVGVASMSSSSLELKAASNAQQFHTAFEAALARIEFAVSSDNNNPVDYLIAIPDVNDPSTWPVQTCDAADLCLDGADSTTTALMQFTGGCRPMPGFSLEDGKGVVMRTFEVTVNAQNNAGSAQSFQTQGVRHPAAGC